MEIARSLAGAPRAVADRAELESGEREHRRVDDLLGQRAARRARLTGHEIRPLVVGVTSARRTARETGHRACVNRHRLSGCSSDDRSDLPVPQDIAHRGRAALERRQREHERRVEDVRPIRRRAAVVEIRIAQIERGVVGRQAAAAARQ